MTKFEEEVKRPKKAYIDPFSKRDVDFTGVAKKFTEAAQTLKKWKEYAFLLEDKLKLQQQALPVVPDFIGKFINTFGTPEDGRYINYSASYLENQKELDWIDNHQKTWLTALLVGFTVEKQQLFYLKNKITKAFLYYNGLEFGECDENCKGWEIFKTKFTEAEFDSMQTGSYELVPVEDGE
ncbi:DUF1642 domain-containing protein [Lactococcus lactis]|uniref:DUF1642 domain-containing protein n=1 Tax=Lactococcus lactis TaxID=1358 RepID=UPI00223BDFAA|nr:DUF1642 domain-containing protein [Lactococcus lactis]MCT1195553.1 DUF1642 domain-containing protein [Lactococcus lactis]